MLVFQLELSDLAATQHLGALIAARLEVGDVISLSGPLGVGKSALARAIIMSANLMKPIYQAQLSRWYKLMSWQIEHHYGIWIFTELKTLKMLCSSDLMMPLLMQSA